MEKCQYIAGRNPHRQDLTQRLTDAVKLVATHWLRDEARAGAYFRVELLQAPASSAAATPAP